LFLSKSCSKGLATAAKVDLLDPLTGRTTPTDLEALARDLGSSASGGMQLVDIDKVRQIIQVCFDTSGSMGSPHEGDILRFTIAAQYLTTFVNRLYGYGAPCIQGLIAFDHRLFVTCPLSPLVPDFEDGIRNVTPTGGRRLWDALKKATDDLVAFARPDDNNQFPNADLRILVISDGDDIGSTAQPLDALQAMVSAKVVCDSVIIATTETCKPLMALSHITGGLSFCPKTVREGLQLFEQEAFLCDATRRKPPRFRGKLSEQTIADKAKDPFDTKTESSARAVGSGRQPLAIPEYTLYQHRSVEIPDGRRRRILHELHQAAAVQKEGVVAHDSDENEMSIFDPDLRIYPFRSHLDEWRVYVKGPDGTPYGNKWWYIYVTFPDESPVRPPVFRFVSLPYHMNVSSEGRVCLSVIENSYAPTTPAVELIQALDHLNLVWMARFLLASSSTLESFVSIVANRDRFRDALREPSDEWTIDTFSLIS
jgi:ubiquitin-protein ligase